MVKVLAVNNYPTRERFERLVSALTEHGADVSSIDWSEVSDGKFGGYDGVVLSGSPDMLSKEKTRQKFAREIEAVREAKTPLLGVCYGHQLMGVAFGSNVVEDGQHVLAMMKTEVLQEDPLFHDLPKSLMLLESRWEVVDRLPKGFRLIAKSPTSPISAMKHERLPLYGVQFHPERYTKANPEGRTVIGNFLSLLK